MNARLVTMYAFLFLPCIFSSALMFPGFFSPFHVPLYLVGVFASLPLLKIAPVDLQRIVVSLVLVLLFAAVISGFWVNDAQFAVNVRQWILYSTLYWCGLIGAIAFKMASRVSARYADQLLRVFTFLFGYGIYTYYAQLFELPEFLSLLRPSPDLTLENVYTQQFVGWASPARAYSVWFEPSFSSIVLACALPLLYLPADKKTKVAFALCATVYAYFTFSRSVWLVGAFFVFAHVVGLFRIRMNRAGLLLFALGIGAGLTAAQIFVANIYDEQSSLIRIYSVANGVVEWLDNPLFGTGQAELLVAPTAILEDVRHIHASIPIMLHWYGVLGLIVAIMPFWYLSAKGSGRDNRAQTSFIYLSIIAITVGGALMMMSIFWFFWGFYMVQKDDRR